MTWVKLDDQWSDHPKMVQAGPLARLLFVDILTYCARYLTDGAIPLPKVASMIDWENCGVRLDDKFVANLDLADELVKLGCLTQTDDGYQVHDYLHYQRSKADVMAERSATAERVKKLRGKQAALPTPVKRASNAVTTTVTDPCNAVSNAAPVPVPIPDPDHTHITCEDMAPEVKKLADAIRSHKSLELIRYPDELAESLEGRRMSRGYPVEWLVVAIGDAARDVAAAGATDSAMLAPDVAKTVARYCDKARAPKQDPNAEPVATPCRAPVDNQGKCAPPMWVREQQAAKAREQSALREKASKAS